MTTETSPQTNFALLKIGSLELCFPQNQVLNIELIGAVEKSVAVELPAVGCLMHQGIEVPVYLMTEEFSLTTLMLEERRTCVSFHAEGEPLFALACDTVEPVQLDETMQFRFLPEPMMTDRTPVVKLLKRGDNLAYLSDAMTMSHFLGITNFIEGGEFSAQR